MLSDRYEEEVLWAGRNLPYATLREAIVFARKNLWPGDFVPLDAVCKTVMLAGWYASARGVISEAISLGHVKSQYVGKCPACGAEFIVTKPKQRYCCQVCSDEGLRVSHRRSRTKTKTIPQK